MAPQIQLPCDGDGICMICKLTPSVEETLTCNTCATPWHVSCLSRRPETLPETLQWCCPDCSDFHPIAPAPTTGGDSRMSGGTGDDLVSKVRAIEADPTLTDPEKARRRQEVLGGDAMKKAGKRTSGDNEASNILDGGLNCSFCMHLPERPVTTPCGHNFCLRCFQRWIAQGKRTCANCRKSIPVQMLEQPRINSALVFALRMAKMSKPVPSAGPPKVYFVHPNQDRPDKAFTTERAKRSGKANACSGKVFVTAPPDHFGPILAEHDPERKLGVLVGHSWEDRLECRQWGAHLPHVAGIAGQSEYGAQSVALSGGYADDEDHGEWFLYTGSGGRDLSGNKRTNKKQSSDQKFEKYNEALRVSCQKGYPVRVVRSHKEKRSSYAPVSGVRYDGIYRVEKCWRKVGEDGFKLCRYLFVRCDNDPAPWTSDEHGDRPRPLPIIKELKGATDITERNGPPSWDYDEEKGWSWKIPPPPSRKQVKDGSLPTGSRIRIARKKDATSMRKEMLKEFSCLICRKVMVSPITTPCAHNFCKGCLEKAFAGQSFIRQRNCEGRRTLRAQKTVMKCPSCPTDISDFLRNPQVNRELMEAIESIQRKLEEMEQESQENTAENECADDNLDEVAEEEEVEELSSDAVVNNGGGLDNNPLQTKALKDEVWDAKSDLGGQKLDKHDFANGDKNVNPNKVENIGGKGRAAKRKANDGNGNSKNNGTALKELGPQTRSKRAKLVGS
ncbi:SRA-YDG [Dillenia turbinata]|uniref:RING-type E3 ubiquitin transferase n=1 Tax=Dillenia turbinata TaxID=194707 RepID=A0AAN8ZA77_9MAGN